MSIYGAPARVRASSKLRIALTHECHVYWTRYNADGSIRIVSLYVQPTCASWERLEWAQAALPDATEGLW